LTARLEDLQEEKMVFVGGPRQVGKTTLCRDLLEGRYSNRSPASFSGERFKLEVGKLRIDLSK
jgi:predicted AAA+ superfamily ATPase